jgi:Zn finger protein HypA/HybF involved in hydrogenase expression
MTEGAAFYDREQRVTCRWCPWEGVASEARHGEQRPGTPHYCRCPDCGSNALEEL